MWLLLSIRTVEICILGGGRWEDHLNPITLSAYIANNTVLPILARTEAIGEEYTVLKISVLKSYGGIAATCSGKMLCRRMKRDNTPGRCCEFAPRQRAQSIWLVESTGSAGSIGTSR